MNSANATAYAIPDIVKDALHSAVLREHIHNMDRSTIKDSLIENKIAVAWAMIILFLVRLIYGLFTVPSHLRHLPCVPMLPLLKSYLSGEVEDVRIKRLILPFANEKHEGVVLVWALGRWMVHIVDEKLGSQMMANPQKYPKELPPDGLLLWRFIGMSNILMTNGDIWKKHSTIIRDGFNLKIPLDNFISLSRSIFNIIGDKPNTTVRFSDLVQDFALDAVGANVLGHDFNAINEESPFVAEYNGIMADIANPLYLIAPWLEKLFPRKAVLTRMDSLVDQFMDLLKAKRNDPGDDLMTLMLKNPEMTDENRRDNMVVLFIAGHETSAAGLSTLIYYLSKYPEIQAKARAEVIESLGPTADPTLAHLQGLPYTNACIREGLRINTPISYIVPRASAEATTLGKYAIPPQTSLILNLYAIHHSEEVYPDPHVFRPERFLDSHSSVSKDSWIPFVNGPRQCPARNFALYEQRALICMLLREYEWALPEDSVHNDGLKNGFSPFALTVPQNLDITFNKIKN